MHNVNVYYKKDCGSFVTKTFTLRINTKVQLLLLFLFICSLAYSFPQPDSAKKQNNYDRNKEIIKRVDLIEKQISTTNELKEITNRVIKLETVEKTINIRFDDLYKLLGTIVTLLIGLSTIGYFKVKNDSKNVAEDIAEKSFKDKFDEYHKKIVNIEAEANELLEKIKGHHKGIADLSLSNEESEKFKKLIESYTKKEEK